MRRIFLFLIVSAITIGLVGAHTAIPENITEEILVPINEMADSSNMDTESETESIEVENVPSEPLASIEESAEEEKEEVFESKEEEPSSLTEAPIAPDMTIGPETNGTEEIGTDGTAEEPENVFFPQENRKRGILFGVQIPQFTWSFFGPDTAGSTPLPCTALSFERSPDGTFVYGAELRLAGQSGRYGNRCYTDAFAVAGILSPVWSFADGECIVFLEGDLKAGLTLRTDDSGLSLFPTLGVSGKAHVGRKFLTMTFGIDATTSFDVAGKEPDFAIFSVRPNMALTWLWF